ncbi:MAG: ABC transporter ATP-binding protein [bacterium]
MPIIDCREVSKTYQQGKIQIHALCRVNLRIEKGEFTALAGPSGSGKTTLLNLIGGLDLITEGTIFIDGRDITRMPQAELAALRLHKIGFVFQSYNLIPVFSALENVEFIMMLQGLNRADRLERSKNILSDVGLEQQMHRRPAEMSGGQQQRVAVARAVVSNPSIILADEPTANLDSRTGESLMDLMRELNEKKHITFIFSTHDQMVIKQAQRVIHLKDGAILDETIPS